MQRDLPLDWGPAHELLPVFERRGDIVPAAYRGYAEYLRCVPCFARRVLNELSMRGAGMLSARETPTGSGGYSKGSSCTYATSASCAPRSRTRASCGRIAIRAMSSALSAA